MIDPKRINYERERNLGTGQSKLTGWVGVEAELIVSDSIIEEQPELLKDCYDRVMRMIFAEIYGDLYRPIRQARKAEREDRETLVSSAVTLQVALERAYTILRIPKEAIEREERVGQLVAQLVRDLMTILTMDEASPDFGRASKQRAQMALDSLRQLKEELLI